MYIGGLVEKVTCGSTTTWKHCIAGASGPVALYTRDSVGTNALHYLTADHLGSIDTVTSVAGALEVRLSFSAFGQRRNAATWSGSPTSGDWSQFANTTRRGYQIPDVTQAGRSFGMPGGGYEMQFPYPIPPEFIKVISP